MERQRTPEALVAERRFVQEESRVNAWLAQHQASLEQAWVASPAGQRSLEQALIRHDLPVQYNPADPTHQYVRRAWWAEQGKELAHQAAVDEAVRQGMVTGAVARAYRIDRAESLANAAEFGYRQTHGSLGWHAALALGRATAQAAVLDHLHTAGFTGQTFRADEVFPGNTPQDKANRRVLDNLVRTGDLEHPAGQRDVYCVVNQGRESQQERQTSLGHKAEQHRGQDMGW